MLYHASPPYHREELLKTGFTVETYTFDNYRHAKDWNGDFDNDIWILAGEVVETYIEYCYLEDDPCFVTVLNPVTKATLVYKGSAQNCFGCKSCIPINTPPFEQE